MEGLRRRGRRAGVEGGRNERGGVIKVGTDMVSDRIYIYEDREVGKARIERC